MKAIYLKTNDRIDPIGIDTLHPAFRWNCDNGEKQTAYRVVVKRKEGDVLWDSGKVESDSMSCRYGGATLKSRQEAYWQVTLWDENGCARVVWNVDRMLNSFGH